MGKGNIDIGNLIGGIVKGVEQGCEDMRVPEFIPTGAMEPIIRAVGQAEFEIVNAQSANKCGKTAHVVSVLGNMFWEPDLKYFDFPAFHNWPYINVNGEVIKHGRIVCTAENAKEDGPIDTEIQKWWPKGRYTRLKDGKGYFSKYKTDTGWSFDILTFEQATAAFEGPLMSWIWCDEPPKPSLMGAIMSRFSKGGVLLLSQTPINAGAFIDKLEDLKEAGTTVKEVLATIDDNSSEDGILNSRGEKRGLMTNKEIEAYKKKIPIDEREARLYGRALGKSGKIYPTFNIDLHTRYYDLEDESVKQWNGYCIMDPHEKYYPFIQWWAVLPPNAIGKSKCVLYNEWPTIDTLGGYYDEMRKTAICNLAPEDIAKIIKIYDAKQCGMHIRKRGIDPRFAKNSESSYTKAVEGIVTAYQKHHINFELPDLGLMSAAKTEIRTLLKFDETEPMNMYNEPDMFMMPHCKNSIRALSRTYWLDGKVTEAEDFKDACDCTRMFVALRGSDVWEPPIPEKSKGSKSGLIINDINSEFQSAIGDISLG